MVVTMVRVCCIVVAHPLQKEEKNVWIRAVSSLRQRRAGTELFFYQRSCFHICLPIVPYDGGIVKGLQHFSGVY
jgi:hypothetical protein